MCHCVVPIDNSSASMGDQEGGFMGLIFRGKVNDTAGYGAVASNVTGFAGNPANLHPLPPSQSMSHPSLVPTRFRIHPG